MVIDDARLVHGLMKNLAELSDVAPEPRAQAMIKSSQTIAMELGRRADASGAIARYVAGRGLIVAAATGSAPGGRARQALTELLGELPERLPPRLDATSRDALFEHIRSGIRLCFAGSRYPIVEDARFKGILDSMSEWERAGYELRPPAHAAVPAEDQLVVVDEAVLQAYLRGHCPGYERATVSGFPPIARGFSKQTILFDVDVANRREGFVYRGATKIQIIEPVLVDIAHEFQVVSYAFSNGAPVAEPLWLQSDGDVTGLRKSHLRHPGAGVSWEMVIRRRIDGWRAYFRSLNAPTYPALELAFQWLLDNAAVPQVDAPVLVHGRYGLHNILVHDLGVSAVLDWEACRVGDRALDLSHILAGTAGKMDRRMFMDAYIAAGGRAVSRFRLKYYQVLMSMQFMLNTIDAQHIFQRRPAAGTNYCTLGLGFIEYTATCVVNGILEASAAESAA